METKGRRPCKDKDGNWNSAAIGEATPIEAGKGKAFFPGAFTGSTALSIL